MAPCQRPLSPQSAEKEGDSEGGESIPRKIKRFLLSPVEELGPAPSQERGLALQPWASVVAAAAIPHQAGLGCWCPVLPLLTSLQ